jgi:putative Mg2+ transporter-C (MgtC) family protein
MQPLNEQVFYGMGDVWHVVRVVARLSAALLFGALLGYEREETHKAAGLRTHMLVAVGAALFVIAPIEAGASIEHLTRVVQGLTAGIGFLGAGAILKLSEQRQIKGLTTAANLWVAAAVGTAVGMGFFWPAAYAVLLAVGVLTLMYHLEQRLRARGKDTPHEERTS